MSHTRQSNKETKKLREKKRRVASICFDSTLFRFVEVGRKSDLFSEVRLNMFVDIHETKIVLDPVSVVMHLLEIVPRCRPVAKSLEAFHVS